MLKNRKVRYAWLKIKDTIQDEVFEGKYLPGDRIASVVTLAKRCGVSTTTVRQAVAELAFEGVLEVRQGSGIIVAPPKIDFDPRVSFMEQGKCLGGEPSTNLYKTQWVIPHGEAARALKLRRGTKVWEATRLHYLDESPVMVEVSTFRQAMAKHFMSDTDKLVSLFKTLSQEIGESEYDVRVASVRVTTERVFSDLLDIPQRTMFFHIERIISTKGKPFLVSILILRSDRFQLRFQPDHNGNTGADMQANCEPLVAKLPWV
jgi:DNA-binding GntR family transcriptional regulator